MDTAEGPKACLDDWRDAVCQSLRALVEADVVFFRLSDFGPSRIDPVGNRGIHHHWASTVRLVSELPLSVHLDGEILYAQPKDLDISVVPGRLRVIALSPGEADAEIAAYVRDPNRDPDAHP